MFEPETEERTDQTEKRYGKYPGRVLENTKPEDADHRGELLVEVPGILEEAPDGSGERALQVVAKPCFVPGSFIIPDAQAQVWVEFVAGEIDFPVWTGVWFPTDAPPRTHDDQAPTEFQKIVRTASGHVIQVDDTENEEKIVIHHKSLSVVTIDKDGNIVIEHKGGAKVELKDDTTVEVTGDTVTVTGEITLDGTVHITGDTSIDGVLTVGTGPKTTIDKNEIKGG
jgi:hypothetical protein